MKWIVSFFTAIGLSAAPAFAEPKAREGEPEFIKSRSAPGGTVIYRQSFELPTQSLDISELTIAEQYWLASDLDPAKTTTLPVGCRISGNGTVAAHYCRIQGVGVADGFRLLALAKRKGALPQFPNYRASAEPKFIIFRTVDFSLEIPAFTPAPVDLNAGPLLDRDLFVPYLKKMSMRMQYPARALRMGAEGVQEIECQVQADRSVICRTISFSDPQYADLFAREARRLFRYRGIKGALTDGSDPRGSRFRFKLHWRLS